MSARRLLVALALGAVLLAGCGGTDMTRSAATDLQSRVAAVSAAVVDGDQTGAQTALNNLHLVVTNLVARGEISEDKAESILAAAEDVQNQLALMPTTTTTQPICDEDCDEGPGPKGKGHEKHGKD